MWRSSRHIHPAGDLGSLNSFRGIRWCWVFKGEYHPMEWGSKWEEWAPSPVVPRVGAAENSSSSSGSTRNGGEEARRGSRWVKGELLNSCNRNESSELIGWMRGVVGLRGWRIWGDCFWGGLGGPECGKLERMGRTGSEWEADVVGGMKGLCCFLRRTGEARRCYWIETSDEKSPNLMI